MPGSGVRIPPPASLRVYPRALKDPCIGRRLMAYGLLLLRVFAGIAFFGHGTQKLFGWWGGYGPQGTGGFLSSLRYRWGVTMAGFVGVAGAGGGKVVPPRPLAPLAGAPGAAVGTETLFPGPPQRQVLGGV